MLQVNLGGVQEFVFAPPRRWRFDWAWPEKKVAMEIEGGVWVRGRHTRGVGYVNDMEKYNTATALGWKVFRFTPQQVRKLEHVTIILKALGQAE